MLRRSHKKSRAGCSQCKRRHVKCDEQRPVCNLCAISGQACSFASQGPSESSSAEGLFAKLPVILNNKAIHSEATPVSSTPGAIDTARPALYIYPQIALQLDPPIENVINLEHIELLLHVTTSQDLFSLGGNREKHVSYLTLDRALHIGLQNPYLLHQLLAFSARHLATVYPLKSALYMRQAITLQTRAVSLFNTSSYVPIMQENCVPILLFSTVLGHHVLADTLSRRTEKELDKFLAHFVPCLDTLRGVYTIYQEARPLWKETVLEPILSLSSSFTSRDPTGTYCQRVRDLVEESLNLDETEKEACISAIRYLQIGFDALFAEVEDPGNRYQMLFLWCVLVPREFIVLLVAKNTEALVVLGYYATLLGYGKAMWQVGNAGEYMLGGVFGGSPQCYEKIIKLLQDDHGFTCVPITLPTTADNPSATFKNDVDAARNAIIAETVVGRDVIVISHSYGGMVGNSAIKGLTRPQGTASGSTPGCVTALILIASGFTITGLSFMDPLFGIPPPFWRVNKETGYAELTADSRELFYHDLPREEGDYWVDQLTTQSLKALFEGWEYAYAGWKDVPTWYIGTVEDKGLPVVIQRVQVGAARGQGGVVHHTELPTSHSPFLSMPDEVVTIILQAVKAVGGTGAQADLAKLMRFESPTTRLFAPGTWVRFGIPLLVGRVLGWGFWSYTGSKGLFTRR
ncbi:hypothetical protein N0V90_011481 [Kalmusia sp. IMI 367209]|nr:hypothetical protein N0V90_011481 [Kalmusia sp. IMI 367209]